MANIFELKPGDSIRNKDPYIGEGEKIIISVIAPGDFTNHALVITALSKYKGLNGAQSYLAHDVIEHYYEKVK